jgi:hypothetical protein
MFLLIIFALSYALPGTEEKVSAVNLSNNLKTYLANVSMSTPAM